MGGHFDGEGVTTGVHAQVGPKLVGVELPFGGEGVGTGVDEVAAKVVTEMVDDSYIEVSLVTVTYKKSVSPML